LQQDRHDGYFWPILRGSVGVNRKDVKGLYAYCSNKVRGVGA
jgi:hypothetical protein